MRYWLIVIGAALGVVAVWCLMVWFLVSVQ